MDDNPTPEEQNIILVSAAALRKAEKMIASCERCNPAAASIAFAVILDLVTGSHPKVTAYILEEPAKCPDCGHGVLEKTLVKPA